MSSTLAIDYSYRYREPSCLVEEGGRSALRLATCGGAEPNPDFFEGKISQPHVFSSMLLTLTQIVRTHFFLPRPASLDPVVTSSEDLLRFEGFSGCCGVYVLAAFPKEAFHAPIQGRGTTNVDINDSMRGGLSRLRQSRDATLSVGSGQLALQIDASSYVEKKVKLPVRWIKAFSEVQAYQAKLQSHSRISGPEFLRFLRNLPRDAARSKPAWIVPSGRSLRLSQRESADAIRLTGTDRLRVVESLAALTKDVQIWIDRDSGVSAWELQFETGRLLVLLSPELFRGFSGEGQVLTTLVRDDWQNAIDQVRARLTWDASVDIEATAQRCNLQPSELLDALRVLGTRGIVGFDVSQGRYFHRELPFDLSQIESLQPRLKSARQLVAEKKVRVHQRVGDSEVEVLVAGSDVEHLVRLSAQQDRCTCPWFSKHQGERGPCKHVLAARLLIDGDDSDT
jgi:hypothetical protein